MAFLIEPSLPFGLILIRINSNPELDKGECKMDNSLQSLLDQLQSMTNLDTNHRGEIEQNFMTNSYRPAIMEALIERKDIARNHMDPAFFEKEVQSSEIDAILEELNLESTVVNNGSEGDEELNKLESSYEAKRLKLRKELNDAMKKLEQNSKAASERIYAVLRSQMRVRPIDEQDFQRAADAIRRRHESAQFEIKQYVANCLLVHRRNIEQARKKRKNFDKDTTSILQAYFDKHLDHPYPSEEHKQMLAQQCGITVQQVNNWFGNQRIRRRKQIEDSRLQHEQNSEMYCQDGSNLEQLIQPSGIIEMPLEDGSQQKLFIIHPQPNQVVITKLC
ncbi:hypothetical protein WR25_03973 isoform C [Diploscapter pachys]|uniref:Uncharacterized protein n=2 Tax=Diploscapter pachys TaxID=2018661 RepID=A0A2A2KED5_9BILA|nr:hypothetical protein WR25_03973 isoform C [Diploscapter pachys]